ncbi:phosphotransferase [Candidatus Bathyarchaeota archaeon A05DMB-2]|jgi:aminoglycoside phosphotransferase family enzyme|nr:phosphotransferase [Candidatus Bathyarchaeota archaeon A05DMB-2]
MMVQKQVVEALMKPEAYDEEPGGIEMVQTHISFVFLTNRFAYKVKKAVNLGFLDFTTLEKRRFYCEKELELNRRLCRDMYVEVVPINKADRIKIKGMGETVEYAVKMKRIPQEKMLNILLEQNAVDAKLMDRIAKIIAEFHSKTETNSRISEFGSLPIVETNWKENYDQTEEFIGKTISQENFELIRDKINDYMKQNAAFFEKRVMQGKVRDCHGDIHSGNIFVTNGIYIFDAIEFNDRFRYSDVASDVAFLAMDLDYKQRTALSDALIKRYVEYSRDQELTQLLPFYKCYRAYVRGKVVSFKLKDPNVRSKEKSAAMKEAKAYFKLAAAYAKTL